MSREPVVSSYNDAESALSDDDLDGVVGGRDPSRTPTLGGQVCIHGRSSSHSISAAAGGGTCNGPFNQ
jgi:hypothetical protein